MELKSGELAPIYVRVALWLEEEILSGRLPEEERVYSQYQLAEMFTINPATAAKGLNILAGEEIIYKKRGLGMFVAPGAVEKARRKRREQQLGALVSQLVREAAMLGVEEEELMEMIHNAREGTKQW